MKTLANVLVALVLAWATAATAAVIYDNSPILATNGRGSDAAPPTNFTADDFTLAAGANVITDVEWTGLYGIANTNIPPLVDDFTIQFFTDAGGSPALAPFLSLAIGNASRTDTGIDTSGGFRVFAYSVNLAPIVLAPGTVFWLSVFNNTPGDTDDSWFWGMNDQLGNSRDRPSAIGAWIIVNDRQDFQLTGTVVPEPATLALLGFGLAGLAASRRRKAN